MKRLAVALALAVVGASCGYRFTAGGAPLPEGVRSVCAPIFTNLTSDPGLEVAFTQALRERLIRAGVQARGDCEARIEGELRSVWGGPTVLTNDNRLASYRIYGTVYLRLVKGERVLTEAEVTGAEDYLPGGGGGDVLQTEASRQAALRRLAEVLMRDGYERLASGW
jgi:hypothetical protein